LVVGEEADYFPGERVEVGVAANGPHWMRPPLQGFFKR
jgi:hypothetical protein